MRQAKSELGKIRNTKNKKRNSAGILAAVNQIAAEYDLEIKDFSPAENRDIEGLKKEIKKTFYSKSNFYNLVLTGSFVNLKGFLKELIYLFEQIGIMNITVEREGENKSLKITLLLSI